MGLDQYINAKRPPVPSNQTGYKLLSRTKLRKMSPRRSKAAQRDAHWPVVVPRQFYARWSRSTRVNVRGKRINNRVWYALNRHYEELCYWRKFNPLQGWFERNFNLGNCEEIDITHELLDRLEQDMRNEQLVSTSGFFYGGKWLQREIIDALQGEIEKCREALNNGEELYYYAWY